MAFPLNLSLDSIRKEMCKHKLTTLEAVTGAQRSGISRFRSGYFKTMKTTHFINLLNFLYDDNKTEKGI